MVGSPEAMLLATKATLIATRMGYLFEGFDFVFAKWIGRVSVVSTQQERNWVSFSFWDNG